MSRWIVAVTGLVWLVLMSALLCPGASSAQGSDNRTPWSSQSHLWGSGASGLKVGRTYPMMFRIQPTTSGTRPEPPITAVDPLADDGRLARPVAVHAEGVAISDLLARLSDKTGVALEAGGDTGNEKVLVFGPPRPLKNVLGDLAALVGGAWRRLPASGKSAPAAARYVLFRSARSRALEARLERDATARLLARMDEQVRALRETPRQLARRQNGDTIKDRLADPKGRLGTQFYALLSGAQKASLFERGRLSVRFAALSPDQQAKLRQWFPVIVAEDKRMAEELRKRGFALGGQPPVEDMERGRLRFLLMGAAGDLKIWLDLSRTAGGSLFIAQLDRRAARRLATHGNPYTREPVAPEASLPDRRAVQTAARQRSWVERLRTLAEEARIPIVSDYYRSGALRQSTSLAAAAVPARQPDPSANDSSATALLDALGEEAGYLWWTGSHEGRSAATLLFRKRDWYLQRQYEVPDRWVLALAERLKAQKGVPTHGDMYRLLGLTTRQVAGMNNLGAMTGHWDEYGMEGWRELLELFRSSAKSTLAPAVALHVGAVTREAEERIGLAYPDLTQRQRGLLRTFVEARGEFVSEVDARRSAAHLFCTYETPRQEDSGYGYVQVVAWAQVRTETGMIYDSLTFFLPTTLPDDRRDKTRVEVVP